MDTGGKKTVEVMLVLQMSMFVIGVWILGEWSLK